MTDWEAFRHILKPSIAKRHDFIVKTRMVGHPKVFWSFENWRQLRNALMSYEEEILCPDFKADWKLQLANIWTNSHIILDDDTNCIIKSYLCSLKFIHLYILYGNFETLSNDEWSSNWFLERKKQLQSIHIKIYPPLTAIA